VLVKKNEKPYVKKIFLILLLTTSASLAVAEPFKSVDISDKIDLQEYAKASDMLQSFVQNPELSAHLNGFRKATFVNVYPKGMLNGQEWILKKLNEISDAQYTVLNAPYLTLEVWFTPDATAQSYTVTALFKTTDDKLRAAVAKVNPALSSALLGKTYAQPRLAKNEVNAALFAALDALQAEIGSTFAPNIAIGYNNNIYTNNQTIEVWQKANEGITLRAVDKNDVLLAGPVTWTGVVGTGTTVRFPITKVGHERVTLKAGKDEISVLMNVKEFNIDLSSLLRKLIVEVLTAKKKKAIDTLATLRKDSIANVSEIARRITELEQYNFPLEATGVTLTPFFADPVTLTDSSAFLNATGGDKRAGSFRELRKRKKIHKVLRHTLNIAAFADLVVKDQSRFNTLLDDLLKNSGQLMANLILGKDSKGQEDVARSIVIDYLNKNLERLASPDALIPDPPLPVPPAVAPASAPTFDATKYLYISPQVQFAGRDAFVKQLEDSLRKGKTYAFINYSQDVSTAAYLTRAKGARPKGVPQDAKYKVYTWLNIPGSVKEQVISRGKGSTAGSAKEAILVDVFEGLDENSPMESKDFKESLYEVLNEYWCAKANNKESFSHYCFDHGNVHGLFGVSELSNLDLVRNVRINYKTAGIYDFKTAYSKSKLEGRTPWPFLLSFPGNPETEIILYFSTEPDRDKFISEVFEKPNKEWAFHYSKQIAQLTELIKQKKLDEVVTILVTLPKCGYDLISGTTRADVIELLASRTWTDGVEEVIILKLLNEVRDDKKEIEALVSAIRKLKWATLFNAVSGSQSDALSGAIVSLALKYYKYYPPTPIGHLNYQKLRLLEFSKAYALIQEGSKVGLELVSWVNLFTRAGVVATNITAPKVIPLSDPFDAITINLSDPASSVQDIPEKLPAIPLILVLKMISKNETDRAFDQAMLAIDVGTLFLGVGEIKLALKSPQLVGKVARTLLGSADMLSTATDIYCKTGGDGQLCEEWKKWGVYIQLGLMSASTLDQFKNLVLKSEKALNSVSELIASIKSRLTVLKNPARPILDGEGIALINGKQTRVLGGNKFDNVVTGSYGDASKKYIWTIDDDGINIGLEQTAIGNNSVIKHTNLSSKAYSGGEVWFISQDKVHVNAWSGRFGAGAKITKTEWEASIDAFKSTGYELIVEPYSP
jgi:hypothetical protein